MDQSLAEIEDDKNVAPNHIGLIIDGNRRWAREKGLPTMEGHKAGYRALKEVAQSARKHGVKYVSAFVFSSENWKRNKEEVKYLMELLLWVAKSEVDELDKDNIRLVFFGDIDGDDRLSKKIIKAIKNAEAKTANNNGGTLALCFNYGGRQEIVNAAQSIVRQGIKADDINEQVFAQNLYQPEVPDIDLVIRTSGERRLSGFMTWRSVYSELIFVDKNWPDFTPTDLDDCIAEYSRRQRRFGK